MLDTAKLAKAQGIRNVMHSNGHINEEPLRELCKYLDAANIDLKVLLLGLSPVLLERLGFLLSGC